MTVYDICDLFTEEANIDIYSMDAEKVVFSGSSREVPEEYGEADIASIDSPLYGEPHKLTINI